MIEKISMEPTFMKAMLQCLCNVQTTTAKTERIFSVPNVQQKDNDC